MCSICADILSFSEILCRILAHNAPSVDPKVAELAERLQNKDDEESDPSDNELLDELDEDDFDMSGMRERRLEALKRECGFPSHA